MPPRLPRLRIESVARHGFLLAVSIAAVYPLFYMVTASLKTRNEWLFNQFGLPDVPTLQNYETIISDGRVPVWFLNSVIVVAGSVAVSTLVSVLTAFAIARISFRGRSVILSSMVTLIVVPPAVLIVPLFLGFHAIGLVNSHVGVILIYAGLLTPFSVYMLASFFRALPNDLFDAARIDGCSTAQLLVRIVLPLSTPAVTAVVVVNAIYVWNEILIPLVFLQDDELRTLTAGLTFLKGRYDYNEPLVMTGAFLGALPMLLVFLFGQRYFVRGLIAGAVK